MIRFVGFVCLAAALEFEPELEANPTECYLADGTTSCGDCAPGCEYCGVPYGDAPQFHLMDQQGCSENDPNGPVYDPVHGVIHHFYQIHLAAPPGHGPDYGHFVSKDFVHWARLPVAIWNGVDASTGASTPWDDQAIFTGSGVVVDGAGPGGEGPGVVQIYPGLCDKDAHPDWCSTGTVLAQAVPADYAGDELLVNWTKPGYNPIVNGTQRDPSTPWQTASGEWRLRTYDSMVYGAASSADLLAGKWYTIGQSPDLRTCECPSLYPLPALTPGFFAAPAGAAAPPPTHVHKTSCGGDWWQLGDYEEGAPGALGSFAATPGWEELFAQRSLDAGAFYASKDNEYPTRGSGAARRINWGWAQVDPGSAQSLPREVTFNAEARCLEQAPIAELRALRGFPAANASAPLALGGAARNASLGVAAGVARQSETVVAFELPAAPATIGVTVGDTNCAVDYAPPADAAAAIYHVNVTCGETVDSLPLLARETSLELRVFADWTFVEAYFQGGRVAMTAAAGLDANADVTLTARGAPVKATAATVYPMASIWVTEEQVRAMERVYA